MTDSPEPPPTRPLVTHTLTRVQTLLLEDLGERIQESEREVTAIRAAMRRRVEARMAALGLELGVTIPPTARVVPGPEGSGVSALVWEET